MLHTRNKLLKIWALLQLAVWITAIQGITVFRHTHIINGNRIEHSHPYSSTIPHSHSLNEAIAIHALSLWNAETARSFVLDTPEISFVKLYYTLQNQGTLLPSVWDYFQRPPPFLLFS